ncbi:pyocin knob domain-containing protein [Acinetobacter baumannii]|nr:pyocin knob domain-containing protein [Acinetobacter baumannii]
MATNWNAVLANITNSADILAILRKVLGLLDGKVDLTKIDEIIADIENMQISVDTALASVNVALSDFDAESQEAIQQVIAAGLMEGFATEAELLATRPIVLKKYAKAEDTDVIWFWNKPEGSPDGNYWTSTGLSEYNRAVAYANSNPNFKAGSIGSGVNLNTFTTSGDFYKVGSGDITAALNYPANLAGKLRVDTTTDGVTIQEYIVSSTAEAYRRFLQGGAWSVWKQVETTSSVQAKIDTAVSSLESRVSRRLEWYVSGTNGLVNYDKTSRVLSWNNPLIAACNVTSKRIQIAAASFTFSGAAYETLYIDLSNVPADGTITAELLPNCLKIAKYGDSVASAFIDKNTQVPLAKITPQGLIESCAGFPKIRSGVDLKDTFTYNKIADRINIYLPSANGNLINYLLRHDVKAFDGSSTNSQMDVWRLDRAIEVNTALAQIQEIVTYGEWEFTMRETAFPADHVGGFHGDELLTDALFLVDGVFKEPNTWIGSGEAKEIRFQQVSNIYRLNTQTPIAKHYKEVVITKDGITVPQSVEMLVTTNVDRFWIALLPILRVAANSVQVTKRDIRDGVMRDVTDAGFTQVYTPLKNGSYVNVSGDKYIGSVEISNINGALPTADIYVSNDTAYNKIYVSAIGGASSGVTLNAGQKISWMSKYKVNAN